MSMAYGAHVDLVRGPLVVQRPRVGRRAHRERAAGDQHLGGADQRRGRGQRVGRREAPGRRDAAGGWPASSRRAGARAGGPCRTRSPRRAAPVGRVETDRVEGVQHLAADQADVVAGLGRLEQRQRRPGRARVLEGVVDVVELGPHRLDAGRLAQQPQLLVVADVREVPHQRRHQPRVLGEQLALVEDAGGQADAAVAAALELVGDVLLERRARTASAGAVPAGRVRGHRIAGSSGGRRPGCGRGRRSGRGKRRPGRPGRGARRSRSSAASAASKQASAAVCRPGAASPSRAAASQSSSPAQAVLGGRTGDRVVEQGGEHRHRHRPPLPRLRVEVAHLEPAARPDRREQRGHVHGEVVGARGVRRPRPSRGR